MVCSDRTWFLSTAPCCRLSCFMWAADVCMVWQPQSHHVPPIDDRSPGARESHKAKEKQTNPPEKTAQKRISQQQSTASVPFRPWDLVCSKIYGDVAWSVGNSTESTLPIWKELAKMMHGDSEQDAAGNSPGRRWLL
jgi:hypothetical protein